MITKTYKIQRADGLLSKGGSDIRGIKWSKNGKAWAEAHHVRSHLSQLVFGYSSYNFKLSDIENIPADWLVIAITSDTDTWHMTVEKTPAREFYMSGKATAERIKNLTKE